MSLLVPVWFVGVMLVLLREIIGTPGPKLEEDDFLLGPVTLIRLLIYDIRGIDWTIERKRRRMLLDASMQDGRIGDPEQ